MGNIPGLSAVIFRCGSGLSGDVLTEGDHVWVGIDISPAMLGKLFITEFQFMLKCLSREVLFILCSVNSQELIKNKLQNIEDFLHALF